VKKELFFYKKGKSENCKAILIKGGLIILVTNSWFHSQEFTGRKRVESWRNKKLKKLWPRNEKKKSKGTTLNNLSRTSLPMSFHFQTLTSQGKSICIFDSSEILIEKLCCNLIILIQIHCKITYIILTKNEREKSSCIYIV
jgi:hypothetical protein